MESLTNKTKLVSPQSAASSPDDKVNVGQTAAKTGSPPPKAGMTTSHSGRSVRCKGKITQPAVVSPPVMKILSAQLPTNLENSPAFDTTALLNVLADRKCTPSDLLITMLAGTSTQTPALRAIYRREADQQIDKQMSKVGFWNRRSMRSRLQCEQIEALRIALREGAGDIAFENGALLNDINTQMAERLGHLRSKFGCKFVNKPPGKAAAAAARAWLDEFNRHLDRNIGAKRGALDAQQTSDLIDELTTGKFGTEIYLDYSKSDIYPQFSKQFIRDVFGTYIVLEHADGQTEPLADDKQQVRLGEEFTVGMKETGNHDYDKMTDKFANFCGDKCELISRLANQSVFLSLRAVILKNYLGLPFPADEHGEQMSMLASQPLGIVCAVKANNDGGFTVKYSMRDVLNCASHIDSNIILNDNLSHWNYDAEISVDKDGELSWRGLNFDFAAVPKFLPDDMLVHSTGYLAGCAGIADTIKALKKERAGLDTRAVFDAARLNKVRAQEIGADLADRTEKSGAAAGAEFDHELDAHQALSKGQRRILQKSRKFVARAIETIGKIGTAETVGMDAAAEQAAQLADDLRLVQQDLARNASNWALTMENDDALRTNTLAAGLSAACEIALDEVETLAADHRAGLEDYQTGIGSAFRASILSRLETARMQCEAMRGVLSQAKFPLPQHTEAAEKLGGLIDQLQLREQSLQKRLDACREGTVEEPPGTGATGATLAKEAENVSKILADGGNLPEQHSALSEAQLIKLRVKQLCSEHNDIARVCANFERDYSAQFMRVLSLGSWEPIVTKFRDPGRDGRPRQVTSVITPAPSFRESVFHDDYDGRGVPGCARMQGEHVCNLAHSSISNEREQTMFAGLRHGLLDAYDVTEEKLGQAPPDVRQHLAQLPEANGSNEAVPLRAAANANMARELVRAAVVSNPLLLQRALDGKQVTVEIDSLSLTATETSRPLSGSEREMLANHTRALDELPQQMDITVKGADGERKNVSVTIAKTRKFSFAAGESKTGGRLRRLFRRLQDWRRADQTNKVPLEDMVGPSNVTRIGGEAGRVLRYLAGEEGHGLSEQQQEALQLTGGMQSAFADAERRAAAISELAAQIKQISAKRSHHGSGDEPYQLAARVALLSNLLGRTTATNCKSGSDRTGRLDEAVKMLAADLEAGRIPRPGIGRDLLRRTNYALRTGNLELPQCNTGLRGQNLHEFGSAHVQFSSKLANDMYNIGIKDRD